MFDDNVSFNFKSLFSPLTKKKAIIWIVIGYLIIHLINLTLLPIFNDESIYLDWAYSHTHMPGHLYDSLLDAKQPLMIWIFAIFENFFSDPLFAGRFASVIIGLFSVIGIYVLTKKLLNERTAFISSLLFTITPIFVFYNRQALMEAGVICVGIWSVYLLINLLEKSSTRNGILLGIVLGIGYFIKSSALLFGVSSSSVILFFILRNRNAKLLKIFCISVLTFFCVNILLFINPIYWQTLSTNNRYSYTPLEFFTFPINAWLLHLIGFFEIGLVFITPLMFAIGIFGTYYLWKSKIKNNRVFIAYFIGALLLEIFSVRSQSTRYLVSFLPFVIITSSYVLNILWKGDYFKKILVILTFSIPATFTLLLVLNPEQYILKTSKISRYSETGYIFGQTSGFGVNQVIKFINEKASTTVPNMVFIGLNIGNPESAVDLYSQKNDKLFSLHIDSKFFPGIDQIECLSSEFPASFVTRDNQLLGMEHYFTLQKSFPNPYTNYSIKIYTLKKNCDGKTSSLSEFYKPAIIKIESLRNGYDQSLLPMQQLQ